MFSSNETEKTNIIEEYNPLHIFKIISFPEEDTLTPTEPLHKPFYISIFTFITNEKMDVISQTIEHEITKMKFNYNQRRLKEILNFKTKINDNDNDNDNEAIELPDILKPITLMNNYDDPSIECIDVTKKHNYNWRVVVKHEMPKIVNFQDTCDLMYDYKRLHYVFDVNIYKQDVGESGYYVEVHNYSPASEAFYDLYFSLKKKLNGTDRSDWKK